MREVNVKISLKDAFSQALKAATTAAKQELKGLANTRIPSQSSQSGGVGFGTIAAGNVLASAINSVASGVASAGQALVGSLQKQFEASSEIASGQLGATSANAALLGIGFGESAKMTDSISATLAKAANTLPGATKDYLQAFNGVSDTLVLSGGLTKQGLTDAGREMIELTALLGQASKAGSGITSTALGKMIGDTGSEALFRIDAFEKVPAFKALLEKDLEKAGTNLAGFFKMTSAEKQKHLVNVKKSLFSDDYIKEMNKAADAQLDTMASQLFDPVGGVFGFLRKLKVDGATTTIWQELGKTLGALRKTAESVLSAFGLGGVDPLVGLAKWLQSVRSWASNLTKAFGSMNPGNLASNLGSVGKLMIDQITGWAGSMVSGIMASLKSAGGAGKVGETIGKAFGDGVAYLSVAIGGFIAEHGDDILVAGQQFIWGLQKGIMDAMPGILIGLGHIVLGVGQAAIQGAVKLGADLMLAIVPFGGTVSSGFASGAVTLIGQVGSALSKLASSIGTALMSGVEQFKSAIAAAWNSVSSAIASAASNIGGQVVTSAAAPMVPGGALTIGALKSVFGGKYSGQHTNLLDRLGQRGTNGMSQIGTAFQGNLLDAIATENRMKPSGSSLMIANSSELIVPREKMNRIQPNLNLSFQINGTTREQILAEVGRKLDSVTRLPRISTV